MPGPRIQPVTDPTDEQEALFAPSRQAFGRVLNIFATIAHQPPLARAVTRLGTELLLQGTLPAREREIVILRVGWRCQSVYEFGQHTLIGRQSGLSDAEIAALAETPDGGVTWSDDEAALIALADELCARDTITDATWQRLAARWSAAELVELVVLAGYYRLVSGFLNAVGVELDDGVPDWPPGAATPD